MVKGKVAWGEAKRRRCGGLAKGGRVRKGEEGWEGRLGL